MKKITKYYPGNDLEVALMFMAALGGDLNLVVDRHEYVPYVKRAIFQRLGEPDNQIRNSLKYHGRRINIIPNRESSIVGLDRQRTFLVETWE